MITPTCQRWRARRDSYRPAGEPIATHLYEVTAIPDDTTAKAFVGGRYFLCVDILTVDILCVQ